MDASLMEKKEEQKIIPAEAKNAKEGKQEKKFVTTTFHVGPHEIFSSNIRPPLEISELLGRISPSGFLKKQTQKFTRHYKPGWGRLSVPLSIMYKHLYTLPSLRGESIEFQIPEGDHVGEALGKFGKFAIAHPWQALKKTLPSMNKWWHFLSPNRYFTWGSTVAEVGLKMAGAALARPMRKLVKGESLFGTFKVNETDGFWKKLGKRVINGVSLGASAIVATPGLLVSQPLSLCGNVLSYTRHIVDGVTTLMTVPFSDKKDKTAIAWVATKAIMKNTALLLPTAALLAACMVPGGQFIPALASVAGSGLAAIPIVAGVGVGLSAAAQATSGAIEYGTRAAFRGDPTNVKKRESETRRQLSASQLSNSNKTITQKMAPRSLIKTEESRTPLLGDYDRQGSIPINDDRRRRSSGESQTATSLTAQPAAAKGVGNDNSVIRTDYYRSIVIENSHRKASESNLSVAVSPELHSEMKGIGHAINIPPLSVYDRRDSIPISDGGHRRSASAMTSSSSAYEYRHTLWGEVKSKPLDNVDLPPRGLTVVSIPEEVNPVSILTHAVDYNDRRKLEEPIARGVRELRTEGKSINKESLLPYVDNNEEIAKKLENAYQQVFCQQSKNAVTGVTYQFPSNRIIDFAMALVNKFIENGNKIRVLSLHNVEDSSKKSMTTSFAWDRQCVEAVMLCAKMQGYECNNQSTYAVPAFSDDQLDAFWEIVKNNSSLGQVKLQETMCPKWQRRATM